MKTSGYPRPSARQKRAQNKNKKKTLGNPPEKGGEKKNPLVLTLGRSSAYTANPSKKGEKKRKKPWYQPRAVRRKRAKKKNPGINLGSPPDLDFRTWVSGPWSQDLGFRIQTDACNASYGCLIFFPSFFSASTVTFLFFVT
jgi:hypothetical protein